MNDKAEIKKQIMDQLYALQGRIDELEGVIAKQKKLLGEAESREKHFQLIATNMKDMIRIVDKEGIIKYESPSHKAIAGYDPDDLIGQSTFDFVHPDDRERVTAIFNRCLETGIPEKVDCLILHADGSYIWTESIGNVIYDEKGDVTGCIMSTRDMTAFKNTEEALVESEQKYRDIFENAQEGIFQSTQDGHYVSVNPAMARMCGYDSPEEMIKTITNIDQQFYVDPEKRQAFKQALEEKGGFENYEIEIYRKDGGRIWLSVNARVVRDKNGNVLYYEGSNEDITRRKQAEEALRDSEIRYRTIFETTGAATIIIDENGTICLANHEAEKMSGYTKTEIEGKMKWSDFVAPEDEERLLAYNKQRLNDDNDVPNQYETRMIDRSGNIRNIINTVSAIPGTTTFVASFTDITDLKQSEIALRESEQKYQLLMEKAHDVILVAQDEVVKFSNTKALAILGYTAEELIKTPFTELIHPDDRQMVLDRYQKRIRGEEAPEHYNFRFLNKWGEELLGEMNAVGITWEGKPATLCFIRDITQEQKMEEQLIHAQKMEAIGTLAGGIAHDFNNLLMGIQGHASLMLLNTEQFHPHYEKLRSIEEQIRSGANLTKQLLGLASGGKNEVKPTNLNEIIDRSATMFGRTRKEITIFKKFDLSLWTAEVDRAQIEQVLLNLYVNAWQAMPNGGDLYLITQNVSLDKDFVAPYGLHPGKYVRMSVTDTGMGMDDRTKERIFDPFFTTKELGRGTGLGLASAYGIIKSHDGFINVFSEKDQGSTFHIYLPASDKEPTGHTIQIEGMTKGAETIMVVDDERMNISVTVEMLEALGYKALTARSGQEAVFLYNDKMQEIDLVILDMVMPGMGGGETFDVLKDMNPDIKVILSSGYSLDGMADNIMARGCKAFIQKPYNINDLSLRIREVLDAA